jgi:hypothetical protein
VAAGLMALTAVVIGAIVVAGMSTGLELDFDRGTARAWVRDVQIALGALALAALAAVVASARDFWLGRSDRVVPIFVAAVLVAVVWAFLRVVQYSG